jgi:hypothetical protein
MIQPGFRPILAAILLLAAGCGQAWVTAKLERRGYLEGHRWMGMAMGTILTLGCVAIIDWRSAALAAGAFLISGLPIALCETWRYMRAREREQEYVRQTETLAE